MATPNGTGKFFDQVQHALNGSQHDDERIIHSGARLTIETIADFAQQLRSALAETTTVVVEFNENVEMDITALQVLCSTCQTAQAAGKKFMYRGQLPTTLLQLIAAAGSEGNDYCAVDNTSCFRKFGGTT